ncbi:MAG: hypothetical protein AAB354_08330 [candidate division KSB1 bacterium]
MQALFLFGFLFCGSVAWALDGALARVVAVEKASGTTVEITLKVEAGAFYGDTEVELLAPKFKLSAKLKLPSGLDMLMKGDESARAQIAPLALTLSRRSRARNE